MKDIPYVCSHCEMYGTYTCNGCIESISNNLILNNDGN